MTAKKCEHGKWNWEACPVCHDMEVDTLRERIRELEEERDQEREGRIEAATLMASEKARADRLREALTLIEDSEEHEHHYAVRLARKVLGGE